MQSDLHHAIKLYTHMQFLKLHVSHLNITTLKDKTRGPMGRIDHLKKKKNTPRYKTFLQAHRFQTDIKLIMYSFFSYMYIHTNQHSYHFQFKEYLSFIRRKV